jgi:hypothetical protein
VAVHYGLTEVAAGPAVAAGVEDGSWTLKSFFKDTVHPSDIGHGLYARVLNEALLACLDLPSPNAERRLPALLGQGKLEFAQLETIESQGQSEGWKRKARQWNWYGVPIWQAERGKVPLFFNVTGRNPQLIYEGHLKVSWMAGGKKLEEEIQGHKRRLPMPSRWRFPVEAPPEGPVSVEAIGDKSGRIKGEVWGIFSIQGSD